MELSTSSISNEIDKSIQEEFSVSQAAIDEIKLRKERGEKPESISNEEIKKGDPILDTYQVLDDAIHGGMGSVWRVHHESWNVDLAMKRPQPRFFEQGSEARKEEFIRECENWINLGLHPNIVSCYYVREIGGVPTIFSEWMDNGSLKDRIRDGSLYEGTEEEIQERILDIAIQTARGLQYSHENNLIHQDVKPGNILLTKDWDAKVADFGLAKAQSQLSDGTKPASSGYTIQYCPKEQAEGAPAEKWMDVYAWALTVLEMYAGKRLWDTGTNAFPFLFGEMAIQPEEDYRIDPPQELLDAFEEDYNPNFGSWRDFNAMEQLLLEIWHDQFGSEYPRPASKAVADTAGALNNRALSFCDLGKYEQAEECWEKALEINPDNYDAVFNRLLAGWRRGEESPAYLEDGLDIIPDEELRQEMKEEILREKTDRIVFHPEGMPENSGVSYTGFSADRKRGCGLIVNRSGEELSQFAVVCSLPEEKILFAKEIRYYEYTSLGKTYRAENSIMISDDGRFAFLYETTQDHWYLFEVETGDLLWEYFGDGSIYRFDDYEEMRMSPDGAWVVGNEFWHDEELWEKKKEHRRINRVHIFDVKRKTEKIIEEYYILGFTREGRMILETNETVLFLYPDDPVPSAQEVKDHPDAFVTDPAYQNCRTRYNQLNYDLFYSRAAEKTLTHPAFLRFKKSGEAYLNVLSGLQSAKFAAYLNNGDYLLLIEKSTDYYYTKIWNTKTGQYLHEDSFGESGFYSFFGCSEEPKAVFGWLERLDSPAEYFPGVKAEYRLSVAESTGARLQTQEEYDRFLREAQTAFDEEDAEKAVHLVDEALSLSGFEASAEALKKRALYGAGLHKTGILNLVPLKEELPEGKKKTCPKRELLSEVPNAVSAIQKSLDEAIREKIYGDIYSTPKTYISPGQCSEDGRFLLINTSMTDERDSDLNGDIEITDWYGAAVVNRFSDEIVYFDAELYKKDPFSYTTELDFDVELNRDGSKLLIHSVTVSVVDLSTGKDSRYLLDIPCRSAHFMEDERFVLCFDRDDTVHVIDAENGEELGRRKLGFSKDAAIVPVDNDCFIFKQEDEQSLGWIVWDYAELHGDKMNSVNPDKSETKDTKEDTASEESVSSEPDDSASHSFTLDGSQDDTSETGVEEAKCQIKKGDVLPGDYEVLSDAVYGGMGKVWHVHQRNKNRDLAMKQPQLRGTEERKNRQKERFIKAHQNWIELGQCPDIVSCYEVTDIDGVPTAFSEWMEGGSLREKIHDGSLYQDHGLWQRVLRTAIQIARGLEFAHSKNVIHCDIKPANILFTADGTVKINDFSLALFKDSDEGGPSGYTPQYCSKEQQEGLTPEPKTDIYSCALTILEILIGSRPWRTGPEVAEQPDKYIAQSRILIPDGMKDLLVRCLKGEVTDASSLRAELENMTIDRPSSSSTDKTELSTSSISNEIDKSIQEEFSFSQAAAYDAMLRKEKGQKPESISNEEIKKGDPILDTYKVLDDAIHGGMGSVWRVHHESWNTDLAMKRPQPRFFAEGSEARKEEFIKECENWINLGLHPNIVSCYYVREIGGVPTIFSEWMDNGSLKDRIKDGSLYEGTEEEVQERILDIAIQTARGLQYSHENNLIHQDVKPGNILLTKNWDAKVADFGLAKAQSQLTENKKPVSTGYTIQYCPREQAEGAPAEKWMDVYAWALTVLEMYAGKRLWESGAEVKEHFDEYPAQCAHAIPDSLQTLLKECLTDSANDFQSIGNALTDEYKKTIGNDYPRPASKAAVDTADVLNNRALSFLDLGMNETAEECWQHALQINRESAENKINYTLYRWRSGLIDDEQALSAMDVSYQDTPDEAFLRAKVEFCIETGFSPRAKEILDTAEKFSDKEAVIREIEEMPPVLTPQASMYGCVFRRLSTGNIFATDSDRLSILDAGTGAEILSLEVKNWQWKWFPSEEDEKILALSNGRLIVVDLHTAAIILDADTGADKGILSQEEKNWQWDWFLSEEDEKILVLSNGHLIIADLLTGAISDLLPGWYITSYGLDTENQKIWCASKDCSSVLVYHIQNAQVKALPLPEKAYKRPDEVSDYPPSEWYTHYEKDINGEIVYPFTLVEACGFYLGKDAVEVLATYEYSSDLKEWPYDWMKDFAFEDPPKHDYLSKSVFFDRITEQAAEATLSGTEIPPENAGQVRLAKPVKANTEEHAKNPWRTVLCEDRYNKDKEKYHLLAPDSEQVMLQYDRSFWAKPEENLLWVGFKYKTYILHLPEQPKRIPWRLCRIQSLKTVFEQNQRAAEIEKEFKDAVERKDFKAAVRLYDEYGEIPGYAFSEFEGAMEDELEKHCTRVGVKGVTACDFPIDREMLMNEKVYGTPTAEVLAFVDNMNRKGSPWEMKSFRRGSRVYGTSEYELYCVMRDNDTILVGCRCDEKFISRFGFSNESVWRFLVIRVSDGMLLKEFWRDEGPNYYCKVMIGRLSMTPDEEWLFVNGERINMRTLESERFLSLNLYPDTTHIFSPDSRFLLFDPNAEKASWDNCLKIVDIQSGQEWTMSNEWKNSIDLFVFSKNGRFIAKCPKTRTEMICEEFGYKKERLKSECSPYFDAQKPLAAHALYRIRWKYSAGFTRVFDFRKCLARNPDMKAQLQS